MINQIISAEKTVDSKLLNIAGIQVARTVIARALYSLRKERVTSNFNAQIQTLRRDGLLIWPNFLPESEFATLREEFLNAVRNPHPNMKNVIQGSSLLEVTSLRNYPEETFPNLHRFFSDPRLRSVLTAAEKRSLPPLWEHGQIQVLTNKVFDDCKDPENAFHSDVWFNTHKAWFYIEDVDAEAGPLVYVKKSHRLSATSLYSAYLESWKRQPTSNPSRRISAKELRSIAADRETVVTCAKNTLVVANTNGYHKRLPGGEGKKRPALHIFLRANPFGGFGVRERLKRTPTNL